METHESANRSPVRLRYVDSSAPLSIVSVTALDVAKCVSDGRKCDTRAHACARFLAIERMHGELSCWVTVMCAESSSRNDIATNSMAKITSSTARAPHKCDCIETVEPSRVSQMQQTPRHRRATKDMSKYGIGRDNAVANTNVHETFVCFFNCQSGIEKFIATKNGVRFSNWLIFFRYDERSHSARLSRTIAEKFMIRVSCMRDAPDPACSGAIGG